MSRKNMAACRALYMLCLPCIVFDECDNATLVVPGLPQLCTLSQLYALLLIGGVALGGLIIFCCFGFCYACIKHNCSCTDKGEFMKDWCLCNILCAFYCLYYILCSDVNKKLRKGGIHIELN